MKKVIQKQAADQLRGHIFHRRWMKVVTCLAAVVVFITTYLLILPAITMERTTVCGMDEHVHSDACYTELQVLKCTLEENEEHTHTEDCYETERILTCSQEEHTHTEECYASEEEGTEETGTDVTEGTEGEAQTSGSGEMADTDETAEIEELQSSVYTYEDDSLTVTAELPTDSTVPADAQLRVTPITEQDENYDTLTEQAQQAVSGQTEQIVLYDVSFYVNGENGEEYLPVSESAKVSFQFKDAILTQTEGEISVLHYDQEQEVPVALESVEIQKDENDALSELTFETEGFSVFAVVKVTAEQEYGAVDINTVNLEKGEYYILRHDGRYFVMMANARMNGSVSGMEKKIITDIADLKDCTAWSFARNAADGTYHIYTVIDSTTKYLKAEKYSDYAAKLIMTEIQEEATDFAVEQNASGVFISCKIESTTYYINNYGGINNETAFAGYTGKDGGSTLSLYQKQGKPVTDLDGKSYAIVSNALPKALKTTTVTVNGKEGLASSDVTKTTLDGVTYVEGENVPEWTFEAVDAANGVYHIYTMIGEEKKFLRLLDYDYSLTVDGRGSLTLGEAQEITVEAKGDGSVYLKFTKESSTGYVNLDNPSNNFWTYLGTGDRSELLLCEKKADGAALQYDINLPSLVTEGNGSSKSWRTAPTLDNIFQEISGSTNLIGKPDGSFASLGYAGELYKEKNPTVDDEGNPYYGLYRMYVITPNNLVTNNLPTEHMNDEEYMFLGWTYTTADNNEHHFKADADITPSDDGNSVKVTDKKGELVIIPKGATLHGEWIQVSAPVYFFVNYTGTILDTEGDVAGRGGAFLNGTAIGHILFSEQTVGDSGTYALAVHEAISSMFRSKSNVDLNVLENGTVPSPQIIIQTATTATGEDLVLTNSEDYGEANARIILQATLSWIQTQSGVNLYISTGNGKTKANTEQLNTDNYSIRWYVVKEQNDAWHIDGVLTAVTKPLVVTKTFDGLTEKEIEDLVNEEDGTYQIELRIKGSDDKGIYMTLETTNTYTKTESGVTYTYKGIAGQYSYDGYDSDTRTAKWTVRLLSGEHVTLSEEDYDIDVYISSSYSVIDGNAESIYEGTQTGYDISKSKNNEVYDVVGGINGVVSFSNTYTKIGKGSLSILKKDKDTGAALQNVTFTLTKKDTGELVATDITDDSGRADFMNLSAGIYLLTETTPDGYLDYTNRITIIVSEADSETGFATITVKETEADETTEVQTVGPKQNSILYIIENKMESNTMIVEKEFKDITSAEVAELMNNYQIILESTDAGWTDRTLKLKKENESDPAVAAVYRSADGLRYRWLIQNVGNREITVTESGYRTEAYIDTYVTAEITVGETVIEKDATVTKEVVGYKTVYKASVSLNTNASALNRVILTNTYTNEFSLYLQKKDSITGQPLQGAVFALYGSYEEATNAKKTIQYEDALGEIHTLYYIGDTEASDENGLALVKGLNLSNAGKTYAYVLSEITAPNGYAKPSYPDGIVPPGQVITVTVENIDNNVYSTEMENQTIGAPVIVRKEVPEGNLDSGNVYQFEITISANAASVRKANRIYTYHIYNSSGVEQGELQKRQGVMPTEEYNVDTCTFSVDLKADEYIVIENVPIGYQYTVKEIIAADAGYDCAIVNENGTGSFNNNLNMADGVILEVPDEITDEGDSGYVQNVEDRKLNTVTVSNYAMTDIDDAMTNITVKKSWIPLDKAGTEVTVKLYQVKNGDLSHASLYDTGIKLNTTNDWSYTWNHLPLYNDTGTDAYDYYIAEVPVDGYSQSYSKEVDFLTVVNEEGTIIQENVAAVHATTATITVTNTTGYELPDTGSVGTTPFALAGVALATGSILHGYRRKRKRERRFKGKPPA